MANQKRIRSHDKLMLKIITESFIRGLQKDAPLAPDAYTAIASAKAKRGYTVEVTDPYSRKENVALDYVDESTMPLNLERINDPEYLTAFGEESGGALGRTLKRLHEGPFDCFAFGMSAAYQRSGPAVTFYTIYGFKIREPNVGLESKPEHEKPQVVDAEWPEEPLKHTVSTLCSRMDDLELQIRQMNDRFMEDISGLSGRMTFLASTMEEHKAHVHGRFTAHLSAHRTEDERRLASIDLEMAIRKLQEDWEAIAHEVDSVASTRRMEDAKLQRQINELKGLVDPDPAGRLGRVEIRNPPDINIGSAPQGFTARVGLLAEAQGIQSAMRRTADRMDIVISRVKRYITQGRDE